MLVEEVMSAAILVAGRQDHVTVGSDSGDEVPVSHRLHLKEWFWGVGGWRVARVLVVL